MKKALIFGAGGFAGKHLVNELICNGYEVYGCSRYTALNDDQFAGTMVCDITDPERVKAVIAKIQPDYIVNMAGISSVGLSWRIPQATLEVNVKGPINIMETVKETGIDAHILFIGSSEEYAPTDKALTENSKLDANNPYGISKMMLEKYCTLYREHYGLKIHYVRAFNHTGTGQADTFVIPSWCKQVLEISESNTNKALRVGNLNVARDFSDVRDVVRAYRLVMESDDYSKTYNICSGKAIYLKDILSMIMKHADKPIEIFEDPKLIRPVENEVIFGNYALINKELGWEPKISIEQTIDEMYDFFAKRKNRG